MTQTILNPSDYNHQLLLVQWQDAAEAHDAMLDWRDANTAPSLFEYTTEARDAYSAWRDAQCAEEERLGLCPDYGAAAYAIGRIIRDRRFGAYVCRLRRLVRDTDDQPLFGDRVVQCPHCRNLFATFSSHDHFCSDACSDAAQQQRRDAKADRRRDRQAKRSQALANRSGICLACGEQFTLQRITAKTCSEACKKRLQRKPELAEQHLQLPPIRADIAELEADCRAQGQRILSGLGTQQPMDDAAKEERIALKRTLWTQRCYQRLHVMAEFAPALTAWLSQQNDQTICTAFTPEHSGVVLGPDLKARLGIDVYTDAEVAWSVRWGHV